MNRKTLTSLAAATLWIVSFLAIPPRVVMAHPDPAEAAPPPATEAAAHAAGQMAMAATNFWNALTADQQKKTGFKFDDAERYNWHFIPRERKGLTWNDMTSAQQALAHGLMASGLSQRAYIQAETIMSLDEVLKEMEKGSGPKRDPGNYAFSIFGTPGPSSTWGWRVEGHHFSLNITVAEGKAAVGGPVFLGSNPAEVREGARKGTRVLAAEEDLGFAIVHALDANEKKKAIIDAKAPNEIITKNDRKANPGNPVGLPLSEMNPAQKKQVMDLVEYYAYRMRNELAQEDLQKIEKAGWEKIHFAWEGATEPGQGHYYRIHGPTFLIEFDNTQNNANHIHSVWRDATNDFGEDILKEHYTADHPAKP